MFGLVIGLPFLGRQGRAHFVRRRKRIGEKKRTVCAEIEYLHLVSECKCE
jgi:hypothetical protein